MPEFDYSAVSVVSKWVCDAIVEVPPELATISPAALALKSAMDLTRGYGMIEIWQLALRQSAPAAMMKALVQLDELVGRNGQTARETGASFDDF